MPQNVKIQAGFSSKETINYQSTMHSISLEMDTVINGSTREIEEASQKLFALCHKIVSAQKTVSVDSLLNVPLPPSPAPAPALTTAPAVPVPTAPQSPAPNNPHPASAKQIKFIFELAKRQRMSHDEILSLPMTYQCERFEQLSAAAASSIIDKLNIKKAA